MILISKYITTADSTIALNGTIPFNVVSIPCNKGCVTPVATGVLTLQGSNANRFARYEVDLQANVAIPTGGAITPLALAITLNGATIPDSVAIVTPALPKILRAA